MILLIYYFEKSFLEKTQTKWIKNLTGGNIEVRNDLYTLKITNNKRELIYNKDNELINTIPYNIDHDKEILN